MYLYSLLLIVISLACQNTPKNDPNTEIIKEEDVVKLDTLSYVPQNSFDATTYVLKTGKVLWAAKKVMFFPHSGFVNVKSASMLVKGGEIVRGEAVIDMTSITVDNSVDMADNPKVQKHLHSADFFDTAKYPTAKLVVDGVLPGNSERYKFIAEATLKVKDKERGINIPFSVTANGEELVVKSVPFLFNRQFWDITYNNANVAGIAKDMIIDDKVPLAIEMTLVPQQ